MKRTKTRTPSYDRNGNGSINRHSVNQHESTDNQPSMNQQIFAFGPGIFPSLVYCIYIYIYYTTQCAPPSQPLPSSSLSALPAAPRQAPIAAFSLHGLVALPAAGRSGAAQIFRARWGGCCPCFLCAGAVCFVLEKRWLRLRVGHFSHAQMAKNYNNAAKHIDVELLI